MPSESHIEVLTWLLALCTCLTAAVAVAAWLVAARFRRMDASLERLARLDEVAAHVKALAQREDELDVRRLEHVLIDIRDGQRRVEDRLLALIESRASQSLTSSDVAPTRALQPAGAAAGAALADRIVTRLLALGYERITFVTPNADIGRIAAEDGAIVVEARRDGAACKGRVIVAGGRIEDLQIQSAYSTFP